MLLMALPGSEMWVTSLRVIGRTDAMLSRVRAPHRSTYRCVADTVSPHTAGTLVYGRTKA